MLGQFSEAAALAAAAVEAGGAPGGPPPRGEIIPYIDGDPLNKGKSPI